MIAWHPLFASPYESPWCVAQKLAWLNVCNAPAALSSIARRKVSPSPFSSTGIRNFNDMSWWGALLGAAAPTEAGSNLFAAGSALLGNEAEQQFLSIAGLLLNDQLSLCIPCIRSGYHSVVHQLAGLARCPIHDTPLHDHCLQCHRPLGPYVLGSHNGFRCVNCDAPFLRNDDLPLPTARGAAIKRNAIGPLVAWIERTLPQVQHPLGKGVVLGRWSDGTMEAVDLSAALLPLLTQIERCPLEDRYLVDAVPQLAIRAAPSQPMQMIRDAWSVYGQVALTVSAADKWLRANVLRNHVDCFTRGARFLWGDREYLGFHPEFCRYGYAFALWGARVYEWLKGVKAIAEVRSTKLIIDTRLLRRQLLSSYRFALNGVELLCEMHAQDNKPAYDVAWSSGCLERLFDFWISLGGSQSDSSLLEPCNVVFLARPPRPEPFCDHGEMLDAIWESRRLMHERAERRRAASHG